MKAILWTTKVLSRGIEMTSKLNKSSKTVRCPQKDEHSDSTSKMTIHTKMTTKITATETNEKRNVYHRASKTIRYATSYEDKWRTNHWGRPDLKSLTPFYLRSTKKTDEGGGAKRMTKLLFPKFRLASLPDLIMQSEMPL